MEFISEDDLHTFEGWLRYQPIDAATTAPKELEKWRQLFEETKRRTAAFQKVGLMKLNVPGEHRYAVAIDGGPDLWLTLWVRCSHRASFSSCCPAAVENGTVETGIPTRVITSTARCT